MQDDEKSAIGGAVQNLAPALATSLNVVLDIFGVALNPVWSILFGSAYGLFGYYLFYQQEKINRFATWIRDNHVVFTADIVEQPTFQHGFFSTLDAYLRTRSEKKARLVQQVFLGFAREEQKEQFELERFYSIIQIISYEGLKYLHFFGQTILSNWEKLIDQEMYRLKWDRKMVEEDEPASKQIVKWIDDNFDPNSPVVKKKWNFNGNNQKVLENIYMEKRLQTRYMREAIAEYVSLGIFRMISSSGGLVGGSGTLDTYTFTDFGWKFLKYLQSSEQASIEKTSI